MRKITFLFLFLVLCQWTYSQGNSQDSAWIRDNYYKMERYIPMRDGVKLFTSFYIPKDTTERHPILLQRTPYSCAPYGEEKWRNFAERYIRYYLREGYIVVTQDVRGRWMSEGQFVDVRPFNKNKTGTEVDEASDTYDAIDWMIKNIPYNNGNVGVSGGSYPGFYAAMAAASGHPALKAVSPQAPVTDWFMGDDFHHNGAFFQMDAWDFYSSFGKPRPQPTTVGPSGFDAHSQDNYQWYLKTGALKNIMKLTGDSIAFWKDLYAHPNRDAWWQARNARVAMYNIKPAMLVVGGLFDAEDCFGAWNLFKAIRAQSPATNSHLVMGPWYHGEWASNDGTHLGNIQFGSNTAFWYQNNIEIPFFNYYLKGKGADPQTAVATIFFTGENQWKKFARWPPEEEKEQSLYLQAGGGLSWEKPSGSGAVQASAGQAGYDEYISDPAHPVPYTEDVHFDRTREYMTDDQRFASRRTDVLSYQTPVLTEDLTLGGPVTANLKVSLSGEDADFVVKLIDVFPDDFTYGDEAPRARRELPRSYPMGGYQMLVRGEVMRGRFRESFEKPVPFKPGKIETVRFSIPDVAHVFKKGHRIMVQVQSSWFPLVDRNPQKFVNIYTCDDSDFQKETIRLYHDGEYPSQLVLPVIK
ncbi:MAG: X-Pro dipeptidyl-peptidase [Sphingobacteriales bacterium 50-39]|nr:CocE/NonD family hydrolase [Sphingobacteriales bacterium]OJW55459.1 MAG: X-Pro dipeptidyl-peptidase [Sphingobacteriales bacterium 50-39]